MTAMKRSHRDWGHRDSRGFTLAELLVVMGIIAVLGALTVLSYRGIAKDAKLASGRNTVAAVLDNARGLAMKNNRLVLVAFRPRLEGYNAQYVECVFAQWTGESVVANVTGFTSPQVVDRFAPIPGVPSRSLPRGIKVAGPFYGDDLDSIWLATSHLPRINQSTGNGEAPGEVIGVMFAPDGTAVTRNSATDCVRFFIDFDNDGAHDWNQTVVNYGGPISSAQFLTAMFEQRFEDDECWIDVAPFIGVFDDDQARELYDQTQWDFAVSASAAANRRNAYTQYITNNVDPIYFNRYTGVAMK
jgi:prepilin-type N-terminal cleavage/methylation domain-containing protein